MSEWEAAGEQAIITAWDLIDELKDRQKDAARGGSGG